MNITLTPEAEKIIQQQIAAGEFTSPDEAVSKLVVLLYDNFTVFDEIDDESLARYPFDTKGWQEEEDAWEEYQTTGHHHDGDEIITWLESWGNVDNKTPCPSLK